MNTSDGPGLLERIRLGAEHENWMMMSGLLALCALPVIGILVLPLFGARAAALTGLAVVLAIVGICYLICVPRALKVQRKAASLRTDHARDQ